VVVLQSLLFSYILFHWIKEPQRRWLPWTLGVAFCITLLLTVLGLLTTKR